MLTGQTTYSASVSGLGEIPDRWSSRSSSDRGRLSPRPDAARAAAVDPRKGADGKVRMGEAEASHAAASAVCTSFWLSQLCPVAIGAQRRSTAGRNHGRRRFEELRRRQAHASRARERLVRGARARHQRRPGSERLGQEHAAAPDLRADRARRAAASRSTATPVGGRRPARWPRFPGTAPAPVAYGARQRRLSPPAGRRPQGRTP